MEVPWPDIYFELCFSPICGCKHAQWLFFGHMPDSIWCFYPWSLEVEHRSSFREAFKTKKYRTLVSYQTRPLKTKPIYRNVRSVHFTLWSFTVANPGVKIDFILQTIQVMKFVVVIYYI